MMISNDALISIIVPVYNSEKYLSQCIDSVLRQTYENFELILVNDGSTDNSGHICDDYAAKDSRIHVIHQENKGQAAARNAAIMKTKGDWIHFVDSDDMIHPQMLEMLYTVAVKENTNISVCRYIAQDKIPYNFFDEQQPDVSIIDISENTLRQLFYSDNGFYWIVWAKLIKKSIILDNMFADGKIFEDNAVVCKWLYAANRIAVCNNVMYFYRTESTSTTRSEFSIRKLDYLWALEEQMMFYGYVDYRNMVNTAFKKYFDFYLYALSKLNKKEKVYFISKRIKHFCKKNRLLLNLDSEFLKIYLIVSFPYTYKFYTIFKNKLKKLCERK